MITMLTGFTKYMIGLPIAAAITTNRVAQSGFSWVAILEILAVIVAAIIAALKGRKS